MNKFNDVFLAARHYCLNNDDYAEHDCFQVIAEMAKVPLSNLDFYLDILGNLELVKYSWAHRSIELTSHGHMKEEFALS